VPGRDAGADGIESLVSEQVRAERQAAKAAPLPHLQNEIEDGNQSAQIRSVEGSSLQVRLQCCFI
jgi:hypothetical protein